MTLSQTKGGKLAIAAGRAFAIITLAISDVCDDRMDVIASGPTVACRSSVADTWQILRKYQLLNDRSTDGTAGCPDSVHQVLQALQQNQPVCVDYTATSYRQHALIIGNNRTACQTALVHCTRLNYLPLVISTRIVGDVSAVAIAYMQLARAVFEYRRRQTDCDETLWRLALAPIRHQLYIDDEATEQLRQLIETARSDEQQRPICLIAGGEPTVRLAAQPGRGGRNQELALRMSQLLMDADEMRERVMVLCAGTDGYDGPTEAAGAIGCAAVGNEAGISTEMQRCVDNNDSFVWWDMCANGRWHIRTGHTGTNVMDLHLVLIGC